MVVIPELPKPANPVFDFISHNYLYIGIVVVIGVVIYYFWNRRASTTAKVLSRSEIERKKRIEELSMNSNVIPRQTETRIIIPEYIESNDFPEGMKNLETGEWKNRIEKKFDIYYQKYEWLSHGRVLKGKIDNIAIRDVDKTKKYEIVFTPIRLKFWKIKWAFGEKKIILLDEKSFDLLPDSNQICVKREITIDKMLAWFYDVPTENLHLNMVNDQIFKHDKEAVSSFYEAESQKRSIIDISHAQKMSEKQMDLQIEEEKRKRLVG